MEQDEEGDQYIVMKDYVHGTLLNVIEKYGNLELPFWFIYWVSFQLFLTLDFLAHNHKNLNVIHRDIHMNNVFVEELDWDTKYIKIVLGDFGCGVVIDSNLDEELLEFSSLNGCEEYIAPEVRENYNYSEKSDLWSSGVLIFKLLTHHLSFNSIRQIFFVTNKGKWEPIVNSVIGSHSTEIMGIILNIFRKQHRRCGAFTILFKLVRVYLFTPEDKFGSLDTFHLAMRKTQELTHDANDCLNFVIETETQDSLRAIALNGRWFLSFRITKNPTLREEDLYHALSLRISYASPYRGLYLINRERNDNSEACKCLLMAYELFDESILVSVADTLDEVLFSEQSNTILRQMEKYQWFNYDMMSGYFLSKRDFEKTIHYSKLGIEYGNETIKKKCEHDLALAYHLLGDFDSALELYHKILEKQSQSDILSNVAYIYYVRGHFEEGMKYFSILFEKYPEYCKGYDIYGDACEYHSQWEKALENYYKAKSLGSVDSIVKIFNIYLAKKDLKSASAYLEQISKHIPEFRYLLLTAELFKVNEDYTSAILLCKEIRVRFPYFEESFILEGRCYILSGEIELAMDCFERGTEKHPSEAYYYLGILNMEKDLTKAIEYFELSVTHNTTRIDVYKLIGDCYLSLKDSREAIKWYRKGLDELQGSKRDMEIRHELLIRCLIIQQSLN